MQLGERFWSKVKKTETCWIWTSAKNKAGYGCYQIYPKTHLSHRLSYQEKHGAIPQKIGVLHQCDNPPCVNPDHLFLGDQLANMKDAAQKGRVRNGHMNQKECHRGHLLSGSNIYTSKKGMRMCRKCSRKWKAEYYRKTVNPNAKPYKRRGTEY